MKTKPTLPAKPEGLQRAGHSSVSPAEHRPLSRHKHRPWAARLSYGGAQDLPVPSTSTFNHTNILDSAFAESPSRKRSATFSDTDAGESDATVTSFGLTASTPSTISSAPPKKRCKSRRNKVPSQVLEVSDGTDGEDLAVGPDQPRPQAQVRRTRKTKKDAESARAPPTGPVELGSSDEEGPTDIVLRYRFKDALGKDEYLNLSAHDMRTLERAQWLNDAILTFLVQRVLDHIKDAPGLADLASRTAQLKYHAVDKFAKLMGKHNPERAYAEIAKTHSKLDLFGYDYLVTFVHLHGNHWILAVVCHPAAILPVAGEGRPSCDGHPKRCTILTFDSLCGNPQSNKATGDMLAAFIRREAVGRGKVAALGELVPHSIAYRGVNVAQQPNHYDCGLYVPRFLDCFLRGDRISMHNVDNQGSFDAMELSGPEWALWHACEASGAQAGYPIFGDAVAVAHARLDVKREIHELARASHKVKGKKEIIELD